TAGEAPLSEVRVDLLDSVGTLIQSDWTDLAGKYQFRGLPSGNYQAEFTYWPQYWITQQDVGLDDTIDSDPDPTSRRANVIVEGGSVNSHVDVGFFLTSGSGSGTGSSTGTGTGTSIGSGSGIGTGASGGAGGGLLDGGDTSPTGE